MDWYAGRLREEALSGALLASFQKYDPQGKGKVDQDGLRGVLRDHKVSQEDEGQPEQVRRTSRWH
jgi:Ca2+-binding EF-hand superfamily protein